MIDFLTAVLTFALIAGLGGHPSFDPSELLAKLQEKAGQHIQNVEPQGDPVQQHAAGTENQPELPPQTQNEQGEVTEEAADFDTAKVETYNQQSGKYIGQVAAVAVEKAEPLVDCATLTDGECKEVEPTPTPEPTPTIEPVPSPIILPVFEPCPPHPIAHTDKAQARLIVCPTI